MQTVNLKQWCTLRWQLSVTMNSNHETCDWSCPSSKSMTEPQIPWLNDMYLKNKNLMPSLLWRRLVQFCYWLKAACQEVFFYHQEVLFYCKEIIFPHFSCFSNFSGKYCKVSSGFASNGSTVESHYKDIQGNRVFYHYNITITEHN